MSADAAGSRLEPHFNRRYLHPRYWALWLAVGFVRTLCVLPLPWLRTFGRCLGAAYGRLARERRRVVAINLQLCLPELDAAQREHLLREHFAALGAGIFETAMAWFASDRALRRYGAVHGLEHLQAAQAEGGVLLLTGHFTTLELAARYLCMAGVPFHAMYRPLDNPLLDYWMHHWREHRAGLPALPKDDLRAIVRALRKGRALWYGPDQSLEAPNALFVPFFGVPTLSLTATSRLAEMGRAKVVPFFPETRDGRCEVHMQPALDHFPSGDDAADATRINALLEAAVRRSPAQYFWIHKRFKYQPPGRPNPYEQPP